MSYHFQDIDVYRLTRKWLLFHPPSSPLFDTPAKGNPLEFVDETCPTKTREMGLPYGENCITLTSTVFDWYINVTEGR